jgi:hypothetical protein
LLYDPGLQLVSALQSQLQVEPEWCVPLERGFQWWPGHLSQRVWAEPVKQIGSHEFSRIHIESDFLRNVDVSEKILKLTAYANRLTTVSAVVFQPDERRIRLHTSICVSQGNMEAVLRLAGTVAPLQAADASAKSLGFAEMLSVEPDTTAHSATGTRDSGHMCLLMLQALAEENRESSPASEIDFKPLEDLDPRPWVIGFAGKGGLTAEFLFTSSTPSMLAAATSEGLGTAMFQLTTDFQHPQLGEGVLMRLTLPLNASSELTNALKFLEARDGANNADQLGGWCEDKNGPVFVTFLPTCLMERDWLVNFIYDNAIRTTWAKGLLVEAKEA